MQLLKSFCLFSLCVLFIANTCMAHEGGKSTIILIRHAEKEKKGTDPALNKSGKQHAEQLPELLKDWKPDAFYSTATKRTEQTLSPWAKASGKSIETYDYAKQEEFVQQLKHMGGKTVVVVGHSNTLPQLLNQLLGVSTYTDFPEDAYGKIWIISIDHGRASVVERVLWGS
jgi:2,3-bisphosphoglycerate-dependent phosphoglycerate mutase